MVIQVLVAPLFEGLIAHAALESVFDSIFELVIELLAIDDLLVERLPCTFLELVVEEVFINL